MSIVRTLRVCVPACCLLLSACIQRNQADECDDTDAAATAACDEGTTAGDEAGAADGMACATRASAPDSDWSPLGCEGVDSSALVSGQAAYATCYTTAYDAAYDASADTGCTN